MSKNITNNSAKKEKTKTVKTNKLTGEQEFALFKKQALNQMKIAFIKSFGEPPKINLVKKILKTYQNIR